LEYDKELSVIDFKTASNKIDKIRNILGSEYGVSKIGIFGSVARNEQKEDSDIDILVEINRRFTLFDLGGIYSILEDALKEEIDLVEIKHIRPELEQSVKSEVKFI
jgi:hypothetical protein